MERTIKSMEEKYLVPALELVPGGLTGIKGVVSYADYECLR